ncbi:aminoglycoside phosphotransferase family protein [Kineococcus sp. SYSU DK003]|uniref:aminoglycoside phosphotransferase family protein n=1 Tax=Kineococcus sp. SYSU DK003 TaxID=3383124 RepID=UPI003D7E2A94
MSCDLPRIVVAKARRAPGGEAWLQDLPARVAALAGRWALRIGEPLTGGTAAWVARVERADGTPAVLKLPVPDPGNHLTTRTLLAAGGDGYVRVLGHDGDDLLLEHLGPALHRSGFPARRQLRILAGLLPHAWRAGGDPVDPVDKAAGLATFITGLLDGPADAVTAKALQFADRRSRAFRPEAALVLHGDAAPSNALLVPGRAAEALFVDPDGFTGDPAYDCGVALRDWSRELLATSRPADLLRNWCLDVAAGAGQDPQAVWEWAFLERVSTGLYVRSLGAGDLAGPFLDSAHRLLPDV